MNIYDRNIRVFKENRTLSLGEFKQDTINLINNTTVYTNTVCNNLTKLRKAPEIYFETLGTISALVLYAKRNKRSAVLNFADALTPGGLVNYGEVTQEEDICRCSNLYESLVSQDCLVHYYNYNRDLNSSVYSDRVIYSKGVRLLRYDSTYTFVPEPFYFDVITCPAPSVPVPVNILLNRIKGFLNVARSNKVDTIVLGAWGCGAFGQDAYVVGSCFGKILASNNYFSNIVFAIKDIDGKGNFDKFYSGFYSTYNR